MLHTCMLHDRRHNLPSSADFGTVDQAPRYVMALPMPHHAWHDRMHAMHILTAAAFGYVTADSVTSHQPDRLLLLMNSQGNALPCDNNVTQHAARRRRSQK